MSFAVRADPSPGRLWPANQPRGVWQRRQYSPTPGVFSFAACNAAQNSGSRPACAIMLPRQAPSDRLRVAGLAGGRVGDLVDEAVRLRAGQEYVRVWQRGG